MKLEDLYEELVKHDQMARAMKDHASPPQKEEWKVSHRDTITPS